MESFYHFSLLYIKKYDDKFNQAARCYHANWHISYSDVIWLGSWKAEDLYMPINALLTWLKDVKREKKEERKNMFLSRTWQTFNQLVSMICKQLNIWDNDLNYWAIEVGSMFQISTATKHICEFQTKVKKFNLPLTHMLFKSITVLYLKYQLLFSQMLVLIIEIKCMWESYFKLEVTHLLFWAQWCVVILLLIYDSFSWPLFI